MITRRNFIQAFSLAFIAGATFNPSGTVFGQTSQTNDLFPIPVEALTDPVLSFKSVDFTPFINTDFEIKRENMKRSEFLKLLDVKDFQSKSNAAAGIQGESFSLMFYSPREAKLKAGRYEFTHFHFGTFMLTVIPVTAEPNRYEAVINHLHR